MINRRTTFRIILFMALACAVCQYMPMHAAEPHFLPNKTVTFSTLSPFPVYNRSNPNEVLPAYVASITPGEYMPLVKLTRGDIYKVTIDEFGQNITYRKRFYKDFALIPVTSDFNTFMGRRIDARLADRRVKLGRESLFKDQDKKAGGLLTFTIPIKSRTFESIFGEGGASLKVSGYRKISFSGRSSWTDKPQTSLNRQSKFPTLQMDQVYRFSIEGNIGSKITVKVNQDSNNDIPLANRLLLRYKGTEDDIIQTVEAGNTTLNLPSTRFLRYSTRVQGLFGLKATAKLADLSMTVIASQEKGSTESINFTAGGAGAASRVMKDIDYKRRTFFDLGRLPLVRSKGFVTMPETNGVPYYDVFDFWPGVDSIIKVVAYVDDYDPDIATRNSRPEGICYVNPPPGDTTSGDPAGNTYRAEGFFEEIDEINYYINRHDFYIQFLQSPPGAGHMLGVYMEVYRGADGTVDTIGHLASETSPLILKLIKPKSYDLPNYHVFEYEWKNVYDLRAKNLNVDDLNVKIYKGKLQTLNAINVGDPYEQNGVDYLTILGLDYGDDDGAGDPNGEIDRNSYSILPNEGYLKFDSRHPFDSRLVVDTSGDSLVNIDDLTEEELANTVSLDENVAEPYYLANSTSVLAATKYYIAVSTGDKGSSVIDLNAVNIIEGSEVITYGGARLVKGQDYNIDYNMGRLTVLDEKYTDINSDLSIMFEKAPFFSLAQKTLLGTRFQYSPSNDFRLGTTILYKSDKSTNRKPKIGEETSKMLVWDVDFNYKFSAGIFTKMVDALPFFSTSQQSFMQLSGELAESRPNPNVDGEVFIDDFEGSRDSYSLGIGRRNWHQASQPAQLADSSTVRGRIAWYNPGFAREVSIKEVYPARETDAQEDAAGDINPLNIRFRPVDQYLTYTPNPDTTALDTLIVDTVDIDPELTWGGFMQALSDGVVSQMQNAQLLEIRMLGDRGILHIDMGLISEDVIPNGQKNDEDDENNRILDPDEDLGLDLLPDIYELPLYPDHLRDNLSDPAGDNFLTESERSEVAEFVPSSSIWRINGTQGDSVDASWIPDTEDLNGGGHDQANHYFSYKIDLSDPTQFEVEGSRNVGQGEDPWKTIRIPLRDPQSIDTVIGEPIWDQIKYVRLWIDSAGADQMPILLNDSISIAAIDVVSTVWGDSLKVADSLRSGTVSFDIAVVSKENNNNYTSPPGVEGYKDVARDVTETEQSLLLTYENLNGQVMVLSPDSGFVLAADTGLAVRRFFRPSNYMGYRRLQAYVHGGDDVDSDSIMFFLRLGSDTLSYYEYRTVLKPGWDPDNYVDIDFDEMTGLKALLMEDLKDNPELSPIKTDETGKYMVRMRNNSSRDPTLTSIVYFAFGVVNLDTTANATGEVWIDELRLTDVKNDVGHAASFGLNGNLANLITYNFSYSNQDAFYRGVSNATKGGASNNLGSGKTQTNYNFSGSLKLQELFPRSLQMRLPVNFNWSQSIQEPILRTGTDITVPEDLINEETTFTVTKGFGVSQSFAKKTKNLLFSALLNRVSTSFKYNITKGYSSTQPSHMRESYSATAKYNLSIGKPPTIKLFKWMDVLWAPFNISKTRLYLYPTRWDFNGSISGGYSKILNRSNLFTFSRKLDFRGSMSLSYKIFDNLSGSYSVNINADLKNPETVNLTFNPKKFRFGVDQTYTQDFKVSYAPKLFRFLSHKVDYSSNYSDSYKIFSNSERDTTYFHNASVRNNISLSGKFDHTSLIGTNKAKRGVRRDGEGGSGLLKIISLPLRGIRIFTDAIKPIDGTYRFGKSISNPGIATKAKTAYRLGFTEDPGVPSVTGINLGTIRANKSTTKAYTAKSGVQLFSGISADVSYSKDIRETFISSPSLSTNITWPEVRFNLRSVRGLWYLGKLINSLSPSSRFVRTTSSKQRKDQAFMSQETVKNQFSPLFSFTLNPSRSMRTSFKIETSVDETRNFDVNTGNVTNIVRKRSTGYIAAYSFSFRNPSGIKLPIFGRIKFESSLTFSIDVSYRLNRSENTPKKDENGNLVFSLSEDKSSLTVQPKASYSFSSTVKGGLTMRWQDNHDSVRKESRHTREVSLWVEMHF